MQLSFTALEYCAYDSRFPTEVLIVFVLFLLIIYFSPNFVIELSRNLLDQFQPFFSQMFGHDINSIDFFYYRFRTVSYYHYYFFPQMLCMRYLEIYSADFDHCFTDG